MDKMKRSRRENGSGSITQRKDLTWMGRIAYPHINSGKPKYFYGKTENEVKRKLNEYKKKVIREEPVEVVKQTVEQYMTQWFNYKSMSLKPRSIDRLEYTLENLIFPFIGGIQLSSVTQSDIESMLLNIKERGTAYSSAKKAFETVRGCFDLAVIKGEIKKNPTLGVVLPYTKQEKKKTPVKFFTEEEIKKLISTATENYPTGTPISRYGYAIPLLLHTGMRIGELCGLRWKNVNLEEKSINICENLVVTKNRENDAKTKTITIHQDNTKTDAGERIIYLNDIGYNAIKKLHAITGDQEFVLSTKTGGYIDPTHIARMLKGACKRAGFAENRWLSPHSLRHTFASMLFKKGVDVKTVSKLLGHADVSTTYNIYIHLITEQEKAAVNKIIDF